MESHSTFDDMKACFFVLSVVHLSSVWFLKLQWVRRHLPPGPVPIPILGTLWCFGFGWGQDTLTQVSKAYGKVFTIWIGHIPMVTVNGFHSVKGLLTIYSKETSWRVVTPFVKDTMKEKGILFSSGDVWKEQRRLGTLILRTLGLGKKTLEHWIQKEAADLVEHFASLKGEPMNPTFPLFLAISNVISYVTFGHHFSMKDETFRKLISCIQYQSHFFLSTFHLLYEVCPWLMCRLPGPHQKAFSGLETIHSFARSEIRRHKENRKTDDPQDFIDYYLEEIDKQKGNPKSTFNENDLVYVIHDLFTAGTDTVVSSLLWALLLMVAHPDIQERVQEEIDGVLEPSQDIFYEDRKSLPYTNAVIHEVLRFRFVLLAGTFRQCAKDSNIFGFPIKKGTVIIPDVASALNDPEEWETPHQFNPDHFLDKDGQFRVRDAFIPFSVGQRLCLGDNLAKTELFIFMTNVLREFKLQVPDGVKEIDTTPVRGRFIVQPPPYKICAVPRREKTAPERGWENRA